MVLRKINAGISLLATVLLLNHAISLSVWMLSGGSIALSPGIWPWILAGTMVIHAMISIDLAISAHADEQAHSGRSYPKMNVQTIVQRVSGVLMIVFAALHIAGAAGYMKPPKLVHSIVPPLFFTLVLSHIAVSASKALITLGIGNAKVFKVADIVIKVICGATLIAAITGFYLYQV